MCQFWWDNKRLIGSGNSYYEAPKIILLWSIGEEKLHTGVVEGNICSTVLEVFLLSCILNKMLLSLLSKFPLS